MLFYKIGETVPVDRFDKVIGGAQIHAPGLIVHNGNHNHRNLRQFRITLELVQNRPPIPVRHDHIEGNKQGTNLLGQTEAFFSICSRNHMEFHFRQEPRHQIAHGWIVIYHQNRMLVRLAF